jgi:hypothetical protein
MAKTDQDSLKNLPALMAKALRRGEKLERTLIKIVAHSEPGSRMDDLLKALQGGLKTIRKNAKAAQRENPADSKGAPRKKAKKSAEKPEKRKVALKKPAPADISPPTDITGRG